MFSKEKIKEIVSKNIEVNESLGDKLGSSGHLG